MPLTDGADWDALLTEVCSADKTGNTPDDDLSTDAGSTLEVGIPYPISFVLLFVIKSGHERSGRRR